MDLPGSDPEAMYYSLNHTLRNLDDATVVYPGHAYSSESSTTIGDQKRHNMYMRFPTLDDFLDAMGYSSSAASAVLNRCDGRDTAARPRIMPRGFVASTAAQARSKLRERDQSRHNYRYYVLDDPKLPTPNTTC